jgi:hypothetical protein
MSSGGLPENAWRGTGSHAVATKLNGSVGIGEVVSDPVITEELAH